MTAAFLTETRERFLKAILAALPVERVREVYLFAPMKQGGVESGVAVIAAIPDGDQGDDGDERLPPPPDPDLRYTVYTARYRHVLKGIDRGKWEASVVAEADAPLLSIESVVRGVQRRAGDVEPPDHLGADALRAALRMNAATPAA